MFKMLRTTRRVILMTETKIEDNWKDFTYHCCLITIPQSFGMPVKVIEIRRDMTTNDFLIVTDTGKAFQKVPQTEIWRTIKEISEELFRAFGIYEPVIGWVKKGTKGFEFTVNDEGNFVEKE